MIRPKLVLGAGVPVVAIAIVLALVAHPSSIEAAGWIALAFLLFAYVTQFVVPHRAPRGNSRFIFGATYVDLAVRYVLATLVVAVVALVWDSISWRWVLAIEVLLLAVFFVVIFSTMQVSERDARLENEAKAATVNLRLAASTVSEAAARVADPVVRQTVLRVADQLQYAPVLGTPYSAQIEGLIAQSVSELSHHSVQGDDGAVQATAERLGAQLRQRADLIKNTR